MAATTAVKHLPQKIFQNNLHIVSQTSTCRRWQRWSLNRLLNCKKLFFPTPINPSNISLKHLNGNKRLPIVPGFCCYPQLWIRATCMKNRTCCESNFSCSSTENKISSETILISVANTFALGMLLFHGGANKESSNNSTFVTSIVEMELLSQNFIALSFHILHHHQRELLSAHTFSGNRNEVVMIKPQFWA